MAAQGDATGLGIAGGLDDYLKPMGGSQVAEALGPFDQGDGFGKGVLDTEFVNLLGGVDAEEVKMPNGGSALVYLNQGECRAGHFTGLAQRLDQGAGESGLKVVLPAPRTPVRPITSPTRR